MVRTRFRTTQQSGSGVTREQAGERGLPRASHLAAALCGGVLGGLLGLCIVTVSGHGTAGALAETSQPTLFATARPALIGGPATPPPELNEDDEESPFDRLGAVPEGLIPASWPRFSELVPATDGALPGKGDEPAIRSVALARGDTLMKVLTDAGTSRIEAQNAIDALGQVYDPRRLRSGQEVRLTLQPAGGETRLLGIAIAADIGHAVAAVRERDGFRGSEV